MIDETETINALPEIVYDDAPLGATEKGWHQIESFLRCPKAFQYDKIRKVITPKHQEPDYFAVGQLLHVAKAHWFKNNFRTDEAFYESLRDVVADAARKNKLPVTLKAETTALAYFQEYINHYAPRPRPTVVAAEYLLGPVPLQPGHPLYSFRTARLDDVSVYPEAGGVLCLGETKSTSAAISDVIKQYQLHGQIMLQVALWNAAPQGRAKHGPIAGVMLDIIQKGYGGKESKFARQLLRVTDRQVDWFVKNLESSLKAAVQLDWNSDAKRNVSGCTYMAGRARVVCPYQPLCIHGRAATTNYLFENGQSLLTWLPTEDKKVGPWE